MNENSKTILFIAAAVACVALAFYTAPDARNPSAKGSKMGQALFESFDPRSATGIEIVEIDEDDLVSKSIEVSQTEKGWLIKRPGKVDYPANADNQVKKCLLPSFRPQNYRSGCRRSWRTCKLRCARPF